MHISNLITHYCNKELLNYLNNIKIVHVLGTPYHPQSQGALEAFNKAGQEVLSKANDNTKKDENKKFYIELNLYNFLHNYN